MSQDLAGAPTGKSSVLDDVPAQLHRDKRSAFAEPRVSKKVRFEDARRDAEEHLASMQRTLKRYEPVRNFQKGGASSSTATATTM